MMYPKLASFFLLLVCVGKLGECTKDPYRRLGVSKSASAETIKKAYKKLAKEWHPDKNKDPSAQDQFIEINEAYQILSDPEKKAQYDRDGFVRERPNSYERHSSPFDAFFNGHRFNFNQDIAFRHDKITLKYYDQVVLPGSQKKIYIIVSYSNWCFACMQMEHIWERLSQDLKGIGFGVGTVDVQTDRQLAHKLSSTALPSVVGVVDGRVYFMQGVFSFGRVLEFSHTLFPYDLLTTLTSANYNDFLNNWADNSIHVVFFSRQEKAKLRYKIACFEYKVYVSCGHAYLKSPDSASLLSKFGIRRDLDTVAIFNENTERPVAVLSMSDMQINSIRDLIEANKYLILPRVSSQERFDDICPPEPVAARKKLCAVLVSRKTPHHLDYLASMRKFVSQYSTTHHDSHKIKFAYIHEDTQSEFIDALGERVVPPPSADTLNLMILWRISHDSIHFDWLSGGWSNKPEKQSAKHLTASIESIFKGTASLSHHADISQIVNEHAVSLLRRMSIKALLLWNQAINSVSREEVLPALSVIGTFLFVLLGSYLMSHLMKMEEERVKKGKRGKNAGNAMPTPAAQQRPIENIVGVHEMKGETYCGLVRLLKPGCRTLLILVDTESKSALINKFATIVYPYRRNASLMFGYLDVDKRLDWYRMILQQTVGDERPLHINARNCVGTVLSLNGYRKYFCIYHSKVAGCQRRKKAYKVGNEEGNSFLGMGDSESSSEGDSDAEVLYLEELLDGFPTWLDRLFEGSLQRYSLEFWPEMKK